MMSELREIQQKLKAGKDLFNSFGNYRYRSAESILEALKPLLGEYRCSLTVSEELVNLGARFYVKSTVTLTNESGEAYSATSFAREPETKKGMDEAQITGSCSSYAKKYALNNLFCIDDTKDADSMDNREEKKESKAKTGTVPSFSKSNTF